MHDTLTMLAAKLGDTGHVHNLLHRLACLAETNPAAASGVIHDATRRAGEALELQGYRREYSALAQQNRELRKELERVCVNVDASEPMDGRNQGEAVMATEAFEKAAAAQRQVCSCALIHNGPCPSPLAGQAVGAGAVEGFRDWDHLRDAPRRN